MRYDGDCCTLLQQCLLTKSQLGPKMTVNQVQWK